MNVMFLGTGAGIPAKTRNVTSIALQLLEERQAVWLFDCGEATQHQILHTSIKPRRIEKIFITHLHGDHIYGLPGLISSRSFQGGEDILTIYGPRGVEEFVRTALAISQSHLTYPLEFVEIENGTVFEDTQFKVVVKKLEHGIASYGYRVIEKDLPGVLLVNKLKEQSIKPGPIYQKIKAGQKVELEDGTVVNGNDFLGPKLKGRIVTILGDTRYTRDSIELAHEADLLIHEATFSEGDEKLAYDYFHSTTKQAAMIAKQSNAKKLILTHISSRYQSEDDFTKLVKEAQALFPLTYLAEDFMLVEVPKSRE
ncbi:MULTISPECIES: ribonuclease Z [Metabacillus]|uniref:Ribonuclease Z n=3 Tax=Metabacillus TaxID=2675233 RepID=A0A179T4V7_9BACI|nr:MULTISPECIES: ribonuclease Z [Metabacillus]OAS87492.1 ribonuclease Z [Metabacillus litoralis]QNF26078.1 ribonuclease Z [Metabacillus sp. KUDC1714]